MTIATRRIEEQGPIGAQPPIASFMALMYHNIWPDNQPFMHLSPGATAYFVHHHTFAEQLRELEASGGVCMSWDQLNAFYSPAGTTALDIDARAYPVLITFDDGWREACHLGAPLLARHHTQATVFVTTGLLGRPYFLTPREVSALDPAIFRVGSHGLTHRMLSLLDEPEIRAELSDSRKLLEDLTGYEIDSVSIPNGAVDARVRRIASECGYRFIFDSEVRRNRRGDSPLAIARVAVKLDTSMSAFRRYVQQRIGWERLRRAILHAPKRLFGLRRYDKLRRQILGEKPANAREATVS